MVEEVKAIQCGKAVVTNYYGTLVQAPTGSEPETCDDIKFTMANLTVIHKVLTIESTVGRGTIHS